VDKAASSLVDYDPFAELSLAQRIIESFTEQLEIRPGSRVLDVGGGTGESAIAILECLKGPMGWDGSVTLLEPEERLIEVAQARLGDAPVEYIHGYAQDLEHLNLERRAFDFTVWSNGIHYVVEQEALENVLKAIRHCTGVKFRAWTTFMADAYVGRTARFAGLWVLAAYRRLGIDTKQRRTKSRSMGSRGLAEYVTAFSQAGFTDVKAELERFELRPEVYEAIACFDDYVENALPSMPDRPEITLRMRSDALVESVREVYDRLAVDTLPRNWLWVEGTP
jgi:SAM-dependent methyltransferase